MTHLVTGGAGFIGSHLVDRLIKRGDEVVVIDNLRRGRWQNLASSGSPRLRLIEADIRDRDAVRDACAGVETVFHLAAQSNVMGAAVDPSYSVETNVLGTVNVLDAALEARVRRLVFSSSREVYGDPAVLPVHEDAPFAPKNLYGASKVAGEAYCLAYRQRGLDVRILRFGNVYGPLDTDRVIPTFLDRAARGQPLQLFGGRQVIDFVWVDLVVEALIRAAEAAELADAVNVASGRGTPITELADRIAALLPARVEVLPARGEEVVSFTADVSRMRQRLGIEPPDDPLAELPRLVDHVIAGAGR